MNLIAALPHLVLQSTNFLFIFFYLWLGFGRCLHAVDLYHRVSAKVALVIYSGLNCLSSGLGFCWVYLVFCGLGVEHLFCSSVFVFLFASSKFDVSKIFDFGILLSAFNY